MAAVAERIFVLVLFVASGVWWFWLAWQMLQVIRNS